MNRDHLVDLIINSRTYRMSPTELALEGQVYPVTAAEQKDAADYLEERLETLKL